MAASFATTSGMAAIQLAVEALVPAGSRIVALEDPYGGTFRYLQVMSESGVYDVDVVYGADALARALATPAALVLIEIPTNPMMQCYDVAEVATLAHNAGVLLAVDNTFYTPIILRPLDLGADIALYSATKYLGGHNDVMVGVVTVADPALGERVQYRLNGTGATLGPSTPTCCCADSSPCRCAWPDTSRTPAPSSTSSLAPRTPRACFTPAAQAWCPSTSPPVPRNHQWWWQADPTSLPRHH